MFPTLNFDFAKIIGYFNNKSANCSNFCSYIGECLKSNLLKNVVVYLFFFQNFRGVLK